MRSQIAFGELAPDNAEHGTTSVKVADGCYATGSGYAPVGAFTQVASSLTGTFNGGGAFISTLGTSRMLAGDETSLYAITPAGWASRVTGLTVSQRWQFAQFGDDIFCTNGGAPYLYDIEADTAAAVGGSPPTADFCTVIRDFVVLGRAGGFNNRVQWSEQGDAEGWTIGVQLAGYQPIYAGGKIMGLAGGEYGLIIQRFQIVRMSFTGDATDPWQFDAISTNYGAKAEGSIVQAGQLVFFYSDRGFCVCDGSSVKQIGVEKIDRAFASAYTDSQISGMWAAIDPARTLCVWAMPDKLWIYNWTLDRWTTVTIATSGLLASYAIEVSGGIVLTGVPNLTVVKSDGTFGTLSGTPVAATFETPKTEIGDGQSVFIRFIRPVIDATSGLTVTIESRDRLGDSATGTAYTQLMANGDMPTRERAISPRMTVGVDAGTTWTFAQGLVVDYGVGGLR